MNIHQEIEIDSSAKSIFEALTNAKQFAELTDAPAEINAEAGGLFSCFDGMITGVNLELTANKRIVQAWRAGNWDTGIFSIIKIELQEAQANQTTLLFDHTGILEEHINHLEQGWHKMYWEPLKKYLNGE
jgi:activator of HSP90 ATPase